MFSPFFCGSFHHQEEEDDIEAWSPCTTPKRSRKSNSTKDSKNPYANRGLDKFSALLAELDDKRQKIYTQRGSEDISFVRFVYSNSNDCKPIVVKLRNNKRQDKKTNVVEIAKDEPTTHKYPMESTTTTMESDQKVQKKMSFKRNVMKLENWRRPSNYFPAVIIMILLVMAVFGRSFAILCTSIGWYLVPTITGGSCNLKRPNKKKEYVRRSSDVGKIASDGLSSPRSVITGGFNDDKSPGKHGHQRSW